MKDNWKLNGMKAIVTGGSKGIGLAVVQDLISAGAEVLMTGRNIDNLLDAVKFIKAPEGSLHSLQMDVTQSAGINKIKIFIESEWKGVDILVNNVGTNIRKKITEYSQEEINLILNTNLKSVMEMSTALLPWLKESKNASIVNISSVAGLGHMRTGAIYGITKAAMIQLTKNLAVEWADLGIRVNAVAPWYTDTPLARQVLKDLDYLAEVVKHTPLKRIGKPEEVAALVRFLCLPVAGYITGQCIAVDGGMSVNLF